MSSSRPSHVLYTATVLVLTLASASITSSHVLRCPCTFAISRSVDKADTPDSVTFDVLVHRLSRSAPRSNTDHRLHAISTRRLSTRSPTHTDSHFHHYHNLTIPEQGLFRVSVHHSYDTSASTSTYFLSSRQIDVPIQCPILLSPDPPLLRALTRVPLEPKVSVRGRFTPKRPSKRKVPKQATQYIAGGNLVSANLVPYVVAIFTAGNRYCSGVLTSARWLLTAAHCRLTTADTVQVMSSQIGVDGFEVGIVQVINHPKYGSDTRAKMFDIAVVELASSVRDYGARFMKLSFDKSNPKEGSYVRTLGFGRIDDRDLLVDEFPGALRQVDLPVTPQYKCKKSYASLARPTIVSGRFHFCAGYLREGGCDACFGDSGGPVIQYYGGKPILQGIVSTGVGCGSPDFPGVYTKISGFKNWLESTPAIFASHKKKIRQVTTACAKGRILSSRGLNVATCVDCPPHKVSPGGAVRDCDACPSGSMRDPNDGSECSCHATRGSGLEIVNGVPRCKPCPPGTIGAFGDNRCRPCPRGTYASGRGNWKCRKCKEAEKGATKCKSRAR